MRAIGLVMIFVVGLLGTVAFFAPQLPYPTGIDEKIAWLAEHGDEYDTLFVGTSRTYHSILPELFDRLMAEAGTPTHSFNLGMDAMFTPEDSFVLESVLSKRRRPLRLVVVECEKVRTDYSYFGDGDTQRCAYWHDFKRLATVTRAIFFSGNENGGFWSDCQAGLKPFMYHLRMYACRSFNVGGGFGWVEKVRKSLGVTRRSQTPSAPRYIGPRRDGYEDVNPAVGISDGQWDLLQASLKKQVAHGLGDNESQRVLQDKRQTIAAHGARMVLFTPPLAGVELLTPDPKIGGPIPFLDFADPDRFPQLFERQHRRDAGHLNRQGAEIFTRLLVQRLVALQPAK